MEAILQSVYRSYRTLPELIEPMMLALIGKLGVPAASIWLRDVGTLKLGYNGDTVDFAWVGDGSRGRDRHDLHDGDFARFAVIYAGEQIGELRLPEPDTSADADSRRELGTQFARWCALLSMRYEVQRWTRARLGRPLLLVGISKALQQMEVFVERASRSTLPVLLAGEFGTEKIPLAVALHCNGPRRDGPFIEVNCAEPVGEPAQWFKQAAGGTLFFNGIDELTPRLQSQLPQHMHSRLGQWLTVPDASEARVVASTTSNLRQQVEDGRFSRALLAELDFLSVSIPPLRTRTLDIAPLVVAALERHGHVADSKGSEALIAACEAYAWPENLFELERVIARLAVMADNMPISLEDIARHTPWMAPPSAGAHAGTPTSPERLNAEPAGVSAADEAASGALASLAHWAHCAVTRDAAALGHLHKALRKALLYLGEHYASAVSMDHLARHAHVSPSHLSYLFRHALNTTFKPLLRYIRIEKAKELLIRDNGIRITEVALSVGFGDLSHFEKSFRGIVGVSPREYRHAVT
ncbi:helix-turn-helix domain-containing protein [Burkholderia cepacia]|uniref:helix-turn-helix domain-containing protein n=1 Tax=Burkholderia cepacia TaxID=292 RepID=UPI000758B9D8|nr:helix-turn-helix domain-containing protein [Burkholderia cepacia]KVK98715.1 transcriptional regulator [Burkholderia cepacia]